MIWMYTEWTGMYRYDFNVDIFLWIVTFIDGLLKAHAGACSPTEGLILEGLPDREQPARCLFSNIQRQILS